MKHLASIAIAIAVFSLAACSVAPKDGSTLAGEVSADNLWAGKVTYTFERSARDICDRATDMMDGGDVVFAGWERQRADYTNICFQVWMPGVTDNNYADYAKLIDVQMHYRYEGEPNWRSQYVNANERRDNNRRYVLNMRDFDPFFRTTPSSDIPYRILSRYTDASGDIWGRAESVMELYFTVNGQVLKKNNGWNFFVKYTDAYIRLSH